jgi:outer membrane protein OmpA-like peptidoglycan-associated protein
MLQATTSQSKAADPRVTAKAPEREAAVHPLGAMHRAIGNQAVLRNLSVSRPALQTKLAINAPGDRYEQEADRVSEQVTRMPEPDLAATSGMSSAVHSVQRACSCGGSCDSCQTEQSGVEHERLQMKTAGGGGLGQAGPSPTVAPPSVQGVVNSPGQPLDAATRAFMEPRFGHDFSRVRIHTGGSADLSARSINALAYTVGSDIAFASGRFSPGSHDGRRLLAHELAHVVQHGSEKPQVQRFVNCNPARLSGDECPPREKGETGTARRGDMPFLNFNDPLENTSGALIVNFDIGSAKIKPNLDKTVYWKQFLRKIQSNRSHWNLVGFTDCSGGEKLNKALRDQRAKAVFDILPAGVKTQINSYKGASISECIRDNTTPADRTLNRSVLFQLTTYDASLKPEKVAPTPRPQVDTKDCTKDQRDKLALAFHFAKMMVDKAISVIDHMKRGSAEETLLLKYFGNDAWNSRGEIRRTYRLMQRDWDPNLTFRCETADDRDQTVNVLGKPRILPGDCTGGTEGYTGVIPVLTSGHLGSILICDSAFTADILPETDLPETILHEISHAREWTFDEHYCGRGSGCSLDTDEAIHNADSYSGFAGEALSRWGPS